MYGSRLNITNLKNAFLICADFRYSHYLPILYNVSVFNCTHWLLVLIEISLALYSPQISGTLLYTLHRSCQDFNNRKIYIIQIIIFPLTYLFYAINILRWSVTFSPSPSIWNSHSRPWSWQVIHTKGFRPKSFIWFKIIYFSKNIIYLLHYNYIINFVNNQLRVFGWYIFPLRGWYILSSFYQ